MAIANNDPLLTTHQASAWFGGVPAYGTLCRWRVEGIGPTHTRVGGRVFYKLSDLTAYVAAGMRKSTSDDGRRAA